MKILFSLVALMMLVAGSLAFAESNGAGCGLGKVLWEGQSGFFPNTSAQSTNITGTQAFGMTSGTSGCDENSVILNEKEQETFIATNLDNLSQDMAKGSGQYLQAMAYLMGCEAGTFSVFSRLTQEKYNVLFPVADTQPRDLLIGLRQELALHPVMAANCHRIS